MLSAADGVALGASAVGFVLATIRWLRVAQREHYLPGSVLRFAGRWWLDSPANAALAVLGVVAMVLSLFWVLVALGAAVVVAVGPLGLSLHGRTSSLAWTRRLRTLSVASLGAGALVIVALGVALGAHAAACAAAVVALSAPAIVDAAAFALAPAEARLAGRYVERARRRLNEVHPVVAAITGSYGKTTTKGYLAHLLSGRYQVLASPRSFNNQAGLARTVNDLLVPGTDVLVAEMGTYGKGELAALCSWLTPTVSVITAIGPVHLERFGSLEAILEAKSEITADAAVSVLNVDDELLARLADDLGAGGQRVLRCSARDPGADVAVLAVPGGAELRVGGESLGVARLASETGSIALSNVACAVGAAIALDCPPQELLARLSDLPVAENRLQRREATTGAVVLDDTFNSNPAGTRLALGALAATGARRRVVVTPGMVELGNSQAEENRRFARATGEVAGDLVVVGRTNRRALLAGARDAQAAGDALEVHVVRSLDDAVGFVRTSLGPDDAVLYENDLPDHYP